MTSPQGPNGTWPKSLNLTTNQAKVHTRIGQTSTKRSWAKPKTTKTNKSPPTLRRAQARVTILGQTDTRVTPSSQPDERRSCMFSPATTTETHPSSQILGAKPT
ncbi:Uncharacterized protein Rs2_14259 [Raphanus sativus]|nr:Uncharacterized protein Rs2_14259 [Raphanus sativus]